jgi:hypothetical protein
MPQTVRDVMTGGAKIDEEKVGDLVEAISAAP